MEQEPETWSLAIANLNIDNIHPIEQKFVMQEVFKGYSVQGNPVLNQEGVQSYELKDFLPFLNTEKHFFEIKEKMIVQF